MLVILLSLEAAEAKCPWGPNPKVESFDRWVLVAGKRYDVRSEADRRTFREVLRECGAAEAAPYVDHWQGAKALGWIGLLLLLAGVATFLFLSVPAGTTGVVCGVILLIVGPVSANGAKQRAFEAIEASGSVPKT